DRSPAVAGTSAASIMLQAGECDLGPCTRRLDECRAEPELVALCRRCLAADPDARPADANMVAAEVAAIRAAADDRARRAEVITAEGRVREAEGRKRQRLLTTTGGVV